MPLLKQAAGTALAVVVVLAIGWIDWVTGPDYGFSLFYLVPVVTCGLLLGRAPAIAVAAIASLAWFVADVTQREDLYLKVSLWNATTRLAIFVGMALLTARLRRDRDELAALSARLQQLLDGESVLARTDPLTGLQNRRGFREALEIELARSRRSGVHLCLAYIDIDNFKNVNDARGHLTGDDLLRHFAAALRETIRGGDLAARLGGDEFGVLFIDVPEPVARAIADRILARMADHARAYPHCALGASIGLAFFETAPEHAHDLIVAADAAMYEAKDRGKGRVELWREGKAPRPEAAAG